MFSQKLILLATLGMIGCTSFRTTVMQRTSDNRFHFNEPCHKTKGIPVKLKIPTHVEVRVVESFLIHNPTGAKAGADAKTAAAALSKANTASQKATDAAIAAATGLINASTAQEAATTVAVNFANALKKATKDDADAKAAFAASPTPENRMKAEEAAKALSKAIPDDANARAAVKIADAALAKATQDDANAKADVKSASDAAAKAAKADAAAKDALAAVTPRYSEAKVMCGDQQIRSLSVQTQLIYTDKVFTVDFRRPAGGVLDVSSIAMDSQQYFNAIQATYQEQTIEQINAALTTLSTGNPSKPITATAGAEIPASKDASAPPLLGTDTRVVALARFDISEPYWEARLHEFVETHVTACHPCCTGQGCPPPSPPPAVPVPVPMSASVPTPVPVKSR